MKLIKEIKDSVKILQSHDIVIVSFLSKACMASLSVLKGLNEAIDLAEKSFKGLIIFQDSDKFFCVGADLAYVSTLAKEKNLPLIKEYLSYFQKTSLRLRYSKVPTVAIVKGYALGGGAELSMHCTKIICEKDCKMGLVESKIGLLPCGGGSKEFILRAHQNIDLLKTHYNTVASGIISKDANNAISLGYIQKSDHIFSQLDNPLQLAISFITKYSPIHLTPTSIEMAGESYVEELKKFYLSKNENASAYDQYVADVIAKVFCGQKKSLLSEQDVLNLELEAFLTLAVQEKTLERIAYTLKTGKHLEN